MTGGAAQAWFVVATIPLIVAGCGHVVLTLVDTARPTYFAPVDGTLTPGMQATSIRLRRMFPRGNVEAPSLWRVWLGIHISHGLGVAAFGLLSLLIALHDYRLVSEIPGLQVLTIVFPAIYLVLSLRFWFYGPALITGTATVCFVVAAVLSR